MPSRDTFCHLIIFSALVILTIVLRIMALEAMSDSVYHNFLLADERYYHDWAIAILDHTLPTRVFEYAPLPAYLMALIYKIFSIDIDHIKIINIFLNTLGCIVVYLIAKNITSRNWALAALAMATLCRELIFYSIVPLKTSLAFFLFALLVYLTILSISRFSWLLILVTAFVLGLSMMVRPNVLILLPLIPAAIIFFNANTISLKNRIITFLLFIVGFVCSALPLPLHNYLSTQQFSILPSQSGFLFYCTNNVRNPTPLYRPVSFASSHPEEQGIQFVIEASKRAEKIMSAKEASRFWQLQVVSEAMEHPGSFVKKTWTKTLMLFNFSENGDHYHIGFISKYIPFFGTLHLGYWCFILLGYTGIAVGFTKSKKIRCLACLLLAYLLTLLLYSAGNRFSLPLLAVLIPASTWLCRHATHLLSEKNYRQLAGVFLILFFLFCTGRISIEGTNDLSNHYNNLAFVHNRNGNEAAAVQLWQRSAELNQTYSDVAALFLAGHYYQQSGPGRAIETLHAIPDTSFMSGAKYATLGDIYQHHNRQQDALNAYRTSLSINSGQRRVRKEIIAILNKIAPQQTKVEAANLEMIQSFYQ